MKTRDFLNYEQLAVTFDTNLQSIEHLNKVLFRLYAEYLENEAKKLDKIKIEPESDYQIMSEVVEIMHDVERIPEAQKKLLKLTEKGQETFNDILIRLSKKIQTESFLRKMSITYLIIMFEDFFSKILKLAYLNNPEILKSNEKLSFEDIVDLENYDSVLEEMINRKSHFIVKKDINEIGKILQDFFKFDLINDNEWKQFTEVFYRRHVIVHNRGFSDDEYKKHTGNPTGVDLTPDDKYIQNSLDLFGRYAQKIVLFFKEKYPEPNNLATEK